MSSLKFNYQSLYFSFKVEQPFPGDPKMAPITNNSAMDENMTTHFSWNGTRFEIGAADIR